MTVYLVAIAAFLAITLGIGAWSWLQLRGQAVNYYKAGAAMPAWVVGMTLCAQAFDANGSLGSASLSYAAGFWAGAAIPVGLAASLFLVGAVYARPLHAMNLMTLPDFYRRRYSPSTETLAAISMVFSSIILIAGNLAGLALILQLVSGAGFAPMLLVVTAIILLYAVTGGLFASLSTSVFQVAIFIVGMIAAFAWMTFAYGWGTLVADIPADFGPGTGLTRISEGAITNWSQLVALGLGDVVAIDFMQRVIAARSPEAARRGCYLGGVVTLAVGLPAVLLGLYAFHLARPQSSDLLAQMAIGDMPTLIGVALILGIIAASMSTAAGVIIALSNMITRNLVQRRLKEPWDDATMLAATRAIAVPTMLAAMLFAYVRPEPGALLILAFDVVLAGCFVPLTLGLYWPKANTAAAITAILFGSATRIALEPVFGGQLLGLATLIAPVVSLVAFVATALATQERSAPRHGALKIRPSDEDLVRGLD